MQKRCWILERKLGLETGACISKKGNLLTILADAVSSAVQRLFQSWFVPLCSSSPYLFDDLLSLLLNLSVRWHSGS